MRKLIVSLWIMIMLFAVGTVPASMFLFGIPEYVTIILSVIVAVFGIGCFRVTVNRGGKICVVIFTVFTIVGAIFGSYCNPYWNTYNFKQSGVPYSKPMDAVLTQKEALGDLEYAMHYLKKCHPRFYKEMPLEVKDRYDEVRTELESMETVTVCQLSQKIEYVFSVLRDAHSYVKENPEIRHYMKDVYMVNETNAEIVAINGVEIATLLEQSKDRYSYEAESWQLIKLQNDLSSAEGLMFLGIDTDGGVEYTYEYPDGARESVTYVTDDFLTYEEYVAYNKIDESRSDEEPFVSYEIDEEKSLAILTLDECIYNQEYKDCLEEMFTRVKEKGIENVAVDLRDNGGGNSMVADEFIRYLNVDSFEQGGLRWRWGCFIIPLHKITMENKKYENLLFEGDVYVLTSSASFSSAMLFAQWMGDNDFGTLIGEAPGNYPNGYGDIAMFVLPSSGVYMQISTKEFIRADEDNPSDLVDPDVLCDPDEAIEVLYEEITQ